MAVVTVEHWSGPELTVGFDEPPSAQVVYKALGSDNILEIYDALNAALPVYFGGLFFKSYTVSPDGGPYHWECRATYGTPDPRGRDQTSPDHPDLPAGSRVGDAMQLRQPEGANAVNHNLPEGARRFTFDTTGGTHHLTHSIKTVMAYSRGPDPNVFADAGFQRTPNFEKTIGVGKDNAVEGVDITVPTFKWTETHVVPVAFVTTAYMFKVFRLTGKTNDAIFRDFNPGEVLFLGAQGSQRDVLTYELTFHFASSPSLVRVADPQELPDADKRRVGGIIITEGKKGWDYAWVLYDEEIDNNVNRRVVKPKAVYVEQVYEQGDFTQLGLSKKAKVNEDLPPPAV